MEIEPSTSKSEFHILKALDHEHNISSKFSISYKNSLNWNHQGLHHQQLSELVSLTN